MQSYRRFWPADAQPHIVGMSYEPTQTPLASDFRGTVKPFHDEFASSGRPLLLTRTAPDLNQRISESRRISFLDVITDYNAVAEMPYYFGAVYYNFKERTDKRVIILKEEGDRQYHRMNAKVSFGPRCLRSILIILYLRR